MVPTGKNLLSEQTHSGWRHRLKQDGAKPKQQLRPQNSVESRGGERRKKEHLEEIAKVACYLLRGEKK